MFGFSFTTSILFLLLLRFHRLALSLTPTPSRFTTFPRLTRMAEDVALLDEKRIESQQATTASRRRLRQEVEAKGILKYTLDMFTARHRELEPILAGN